MHGRSSLVYHRHGAGHAATVDLNACIFRGIKSPFSVIRYHSLIVESESLAQCPNLISTAWTSDGISMGLQHATLPIYGIQFHPEASSVFYSCLFDLI